MRLKKQNINYEKTIFIALFILISTSSLLLAKPYKVFPILMVHGNSGNFGSWQYDNSIYLGTITFLNNLYSNCYGDRNSRYLPVEYHSALKMTYSEIGNLSIFGLSFTKNKGPILDNSEELDMVINGVSGPPPGEAGQVFAPLLFAAVGIDRIHHQACLHRHHRTIATVDALDLARHQPVAHIRAAQPAVFFWNGDAQKPHLAHLAQDCRLGCLTL